ncbi:hypothetical protein AB0H57_24575 [Micromonospora sp. NPDC050686]|uniref:hypothetical protein n=1 Tax=Micromonospora sp. NPDC050686 TaxID=3154631 RepID=UPI0033F3A851
MSGRAVRCRYRRRNDEMCAGEVVDADGEILLCGKHLARALQLVQVHMVAQAAHPGR